MLASHNACDRKESRTYYHTHTERYQAPHTEHTLQALTAFVSGLTQEFVGGLFYK